MSPDDELWHAALGWQLRECREGRTYVAIADDLGVSPNAVQAWFSGGRRIYGRQLRRLCQLLEVSMDDVCQAAEEHAKDSGGEQ